MRAASYLLLRQGRKPAFNLIQPRSRCWREMDMEAGVAGKPVPDGRRLMGAIVVHHEMHIEILRNGCFDGAKEFQKFSAAMATMQLTNDLAGGDVERGEQCGRPVALVIMRAPFGNAGRQGQNRLGPVERLDLAFLIDAEHHGFDRRINVQAHNVPGLFNKQWIGGQLERFLAVRLQPESAPNPTYRCLRQLAFFGHCPRTPMGGIHRLRFQGLGDDSIHARVVDRPGRTGARRIKQAIKPHLQEAASPFAHCLFRHLQVRRNRLVLSAI